MLWAFASKRRFQRLRCPKAFPPSPSPEKHIPSSKYQPGASGPVEGEGRIKVYHQNPPGDFGRNAVRGLICWGPKEKKVENSQGFVGFGFVFLSEVCMLVYLLLFIDDCLGF